MTDLNKAVATWQQASDLYDAQHNTKGQKRKAIRVQRDTLYKEAQRLAGGYGPLMTELTKRKIITWAF